MSSRKHIHPVVMAGGSGTRLWPLSREQRPKQLVAIGSGDSLLDNTLARLRRDTLAAPIVFCSARHSFLCEDAVRRAGNPGAILVEPAGRNTAAVAALAALIVEQADPDGLVLLAPADHAMDGGEIFGAGIEAAAQAARAGYIVTFGIRARQPTSAYGYICAGEPISGMTSARRVARFVEKPDRERAASLIADGASWNSGMFLFSPKTLLGEFRRLRPDVLESCRAALPDLKLDGRTYQIDADAFAEVPAISIDYAILEQTDRAAVVPLDLTWSDVGTWSSVWALGPQDEQGNVASGDVLLEDCRDMLVQGSDRLVAGVGLRDLVIVDTPDAVMVADRHRSQDVRRIVERLKGAGRREVEEHRRVDRPWGDYKSIETGPGFQVKLITVKPGKRLSLQKHAHRAEHWVIVRGTGKVTRDDEVFLLREGETAFIPLGAKHRLENPGTEPLWLVEVQIGGYLGEDDIVRFDDDFGRADPAQRKRAAAE